MSHVKSLLHRSVIRYKVTCHKWFQEFSSGVVQGQLTFFNTNGVQLFINFKGNSNFPVWSIFSLGWGPMIHKETYIPLVIFQEGVQDHPCADPERFVRGGPSFFYFSLMRRGRIQIPL